MPLFSPEKIRAIVYQNGVAGKVCINPGCGWKPLSEFPPRRVLSMPASDRCKSECREYWNAQSRAELASNINKYRAAQHKYVEANKKRYRELKRKHQAENPEKYEEVIAGTRERCQENLEHHREIGRNSFEHHAEERHKYSLEYYKQDPEKPVAVNNRRRALKYASESTHTEQEWQKLKAEYNFR